MRAVSTVAVLPIKRFAHAKQRLDLDDRAAVMREMAEGVLGALAASSVDATLVELVDGREVPFPTAGINRPDTANATERFISIQSAVVDPADRLWALDTGRLNFGPLIPGGPKLVGIDLRTNRVARTIRFPADVVLPTTYLNDVRFDLRRGRAGLAFITDSGDEGPNGIIVVDLASGRSWRKLTGHPSVRAEPGFTAVIEG